MHACLVCADPVVEPLLDLGPQSLSNRFLASPDEPEVSFPFALDQCQACGLIQWRDPIPPEELRPRVDWIRYHEAEGHLDDLVERLRRLSGIATASSIGAVSSKDDSTVARLRKMGFHHSWRLDPKLDLQIDDACAGLETLQDRLTPSRARTIAARHGTADVLIARHVLEHAHSPREFSEALRLLVRPQGYVVFEVPDCSPALSCGDYTMPWEEHLTYFTQGLFAPSLSRLGWVARYEACIPYGKENSLIAIAQSRTPADPNIERETEIEDALTLGRSYAAGFPAQRTESESILSAHRRDGAPIALFGAGHLACAWINFLGLARCLDFVVDDHPRKAGRFLPGSRLPILPSSQLLERGVRLCLTTLSPESLAQMMTRQQGFLARGGRFVSVFPGRSDSLLRSGEIRAEIGPT